MDGLTRTWLRWTAAFWRWLARIGRSCWPGARPAPPAADVAVHVEAAQAIEINVVLREETPPGIARMAALLDGWAYESRVPPPG